MGWGLMIFKQAEDNINQNMFLTTVNPRDFPGRIINAAANKVVAF